MLNISKGAMPHPTCCRYDYHLFVVAINIDDDEMLMRKKIRLATFSTFNHAVVSSESRHPADVIKFGPKPKIVVTLQQNAYWRWLTPHLLSF